VHELTRTDPDVEIVWRAFELRPDPVPPLDPGGDYLRRVWASSVYPMAERLGVLMKLPPIQPRSRRAHEAAHWARDHGQFDGYHADLFRAFFERGENIGDTDVLVSLAETRGLPGDSLRDALHQRTFERGVLDDERDAQAMGLGGVPAFVADRRAAMTGVQPVESLTELVRHVRSLDLEERNKPHAR
jgi:predicted DsbA family dithiol-disulfide isomerase